MFSSDENLRSNKTRLLTIQADGLKRVLLISGLSWSPSLMGIPSDQIFFFDYFFCTKFTPVIVSKEYENSQMSQITGFDFIVCFMFINLHLSVKLHCSNIKNLQNFRRCVGKLDLEFFWETSGWVNFCDADRSLGCILNQ